MVYIHIVGSLAICIKLHNYRATTVMDIAYIEPPKNMDFC